LKRRVTRSAAFLLNPASGCQAFPFLSVELGIGYAKFRSRSHDAVIRVYDAAGNVIETHEHKGEFKEP
jgi:hypothetical protein